MSPMLVTQLRPGDLIGHGHANHGGVYLVTKVQPANTFPGWACSSSANVLVTLHGDYRFNHGFNHATFADEVHTYWRQSWACRKDRPGTGFLRVHQVRIALGLQPWDDTRKTSTAHGEALRYFVLRGQGSWLPRHGDYEPDELVRQAAELQERQAVEAIRGFFPPPLWSSRADLARWTEAAA